MARFVVVPVLLVQGGLPLAEHWKIYFPTVMLSVCVDGVPLIVPSARAWMRPLLQLVVYGPGGAARFPARRRHLGLDVRSCCHFLHRLQHSGSELALSGIALAPASAKGLALAYNTAQALGLFAGGALGGAIVARWGSEAVFVFAAVVTAAWWLIALGMREVPIKASEPLPI